MNFKSKTMYGKITIGCGSKDEKELEIVDFIRANFIDNRLVSICKIEDESFLLSVENPSSTGRATQSTMWLSKESLTGLLTTIMLYFNVKEEDMDEMFEQIAKDKEVNYTCSDNLKPLLSVSLKTKNHK